ncbi:acyl-CoA desaturase (plasmid) [Ralstonia syzygii]|uniref:Acyl-CoA desaturase n=2 Tax=Ralstonia syzygii TaxID=28097 RepID=A0ABX7ZLB9_9RALS|nr:acyl-CoA desaturase [Ralstonia syzygii]
MIDESAMLRQHNQKLRKYDYVLGRLFVALPVSGFVLAVLLWFAGWPVGIFELTMCLAMYLFTMMGIEIGFHRCFAHRAFRASPGLQWVLAVAGSMGGHGPLIWWVTTHRRHHRFVDTEQDPHTPNKDLRGPWRNFKSFLYGYVGWTLDTDVKLQEGWQRYGLDLYKNSILFKVHARFALISLLGLLVPAVAGALFHRSAEGALLGLVWGGLVPICLTQHLFWMINAFGHRIGAKPFTSRIAGESRNCWWLALPTLGQGWHNNHHADPGCATTRKTWWQLDPGAWLIRLFERLGWASAVKWK